MQIQRNADLIKAFSDLSEQVSFGGRNYRFWFPKCLTLRKSPHTYLVEGQDLFLLFRSVLVGAVVQRVKKGEANRVYVINSGLRNAEGKLVGYLMGLYKYKCDYNPIWSDVFDVEKNELVVFKNILPLYGFYCDITVTIPSEAIKAHKVYIHEKRWHEKGCFDSEGRMRDNRCILFNEVRADFPTDDEPGECVGW
jgi:hypothetical protein